MTIPTIKKLEIPRWSLLGTDVDDTYYGLYRPFVSVTGELVLGKPLAIFCGRDLAETFLRTVGDKDGVILPIRRLDGIVFESEDERVLPGIGDTPWPHDVAYKNPDEALRAIFSRSDTDQRDAARYRRLRVLGAAPAQSAALDGGTVLRFTNLDAYVDHDLETHPSRGEAPPLDETRKP